MRDSPASVSSSASTSGTIIKRHVTSPSPLTSSSGVSSGVTSPPSSGDDKSNRCNCCLFGHHIDMSFVQYAQNVSNGIISRQGTPTNMNPRGNGGDRQLMSPLDNSIFSDSLDNLMSDFDDILTPHKENEMKMHQSRSQEKSMHDVRNRLQGGYNSDYTTYRRNAQNGASESPRRAHFEPVKPNPISRPINLGINVSRSNTPTMNGGGRYGNGYSTALGKAVSEIRAQNSESPFPDSRVGTPVDLGLHHSNGNGTNGFYHTTPTPSRFATRHDDLPPTPTPTFRRAPSHGDLPRSNHTFSYAQHQNGHGHLNGNGHGHGHGHGNGSGHGSGNGNEFASLRRGREYTLPDQDAHRVRYFSASPKLPRRLQAGPVIDVESHFTYANGLDGQRVLARTQSTSTSPPPEVSAFEPVQKQGQNGKVATVHPIQKPVGTRSIGVTTGPLPAPKPCGECAALRRELFQAIEKVPPPPPETCSVETSTVTIEFSDKSIGHEPVEMCHVAIGTEPKEFVDIGTVPESRRVLHIDVQTEKSTVDTACSPIHFETQVEGKEVQTEKEPEPEPEPVITVAVAPPTVTSSEAKEECEECLKRKDVFTRNVGVGACSVSDKICVSCDKEVEEIDETEAPGFKADVENDQKQREFEIAKANAVKKLLTNEQKSNFRRGITVSKSARFERRKSVGDLDYIVDKNSPAQSEVPDKTTIPENSEALKAKIVLKKDVVIEPPTPPPPPPACVVPAPVPARIPRPKISKWATPEECAETPDEEEEAQDRLTPLRSDMRQLGNRYPPRNSINNNLGGSHHLPYPDTESQEDLSDSDAESDCSAHSDGTFEVTDDVFDAAPFEVSDRLREALENFNSSILEPGSVPDDTVEWSAKLVRHEWMKTAGRRASRYEHVDKFIEELKNLGPQILSAVVNLSDQNGNTALHYAVSHANFAVVSSILDSGECDLDTPNRAGYTAVMLAALSQLEDEMEKAVVHRLFQMGDVNAKASQHGQTALMLAVSHGKKTTTELLLSCGADVNVQDEEGSTALMCAAEHGHRDIVKMLLADNTVNATLTDCDNSTALSIALENDHRAIGVMIYAYLNHSRLDISGPTSTI